MSDDGGTDIGEDTGGTDSGETDTTDTTDGDMGDDGGTDSGETDMADDTGTDSGETDMADDTGTDSGDTDMADDTGTDSGETDMGGDTDPGTGDDSDAEQQAAVFSDVDPNNTHAAAIAAILAANITTGCNQNPLRYCPDQPVTRAQMASFLVRALKLPAADAAGFTDIDPTGTHTADINALATANITTGCNQNPLRYCPNAPVTRAQMASFLVRALKLPAADAAGFTDIDPTGTHTADINALFAEGITTGCSQTPLRYCPDQPVTRAQMASFLTRALGL
ncbi:MAG: S-layer homology domain-containing protein [Acidimicrobiia bacterium]|nr:S-layer homology domain-containing protein [Acidimicrobiia bacterium]